MSADFVRYSPEIETFDPKLSEYMTQIIDFWEKKVASSPVTEGSGRAVRGAHANLSATEDEIVQRNRRRPHAYDYLRPSLIPNSTNI